MASKKETGAIAGAGMAALLVLGGYSAITRYSKETFGDEYAVFDIGSQMLSSSECRTQVPFPKDNEVIVFLSDTDIQEKTLPQPLNPQDNNPSAFISNLADNNGLTVFNNLNTKEAINSAQTHDEVLEEVNAFTQNYGVKVALPLGDTYLDANKYIPFRKEEYDLEDFKDRAIGLTNFLSNVPEEVVSLGNISTINLVHENRFEGIGTELIPNRSPDSYYNPYTDNMYIELNNEVKSWKFQRAFNASTAAAIDIEVCGLMGAEFDSGFTKGNETLELKDSNIIDSIDKISELDGDLKTITQKGLLVERFISPNPNFPISDATLDDRNKIWYQILRINEHVPGYSDFWKELTLQYSGPILDEITVNPPETSA